jgi:uncharacterized membrane protein YfcA
VTLGAIAIGFVAGGIAGMFGVGGGVVFVPGLVFLLGLNQVDAEATSLLAIVPVALVGAYRQSTYGNLRLRDGILVGVLAVPFAALGVVIVNAIPERAIEPLDDEHPTGCRSGPHLDGPMPRRCPRDRPSLG